MKRLIYFVGVCILCTVMVTACTSSEIKEEQEVSNLIEETNTNKEAIKVDGEYLMIDKEAFTDVFNTMLENSDILKDIGKIKKWDKTSLENFEIYETTVSNFTIELTKYKENEKYSGISVDSVYNSEENDKNVFTIICILAMMCENFDDSELKKFQNDILETFNTVIDTKESQYILGKKCVYLVSYNSYKSSDTISFVAVPATEEQISEIIAFCSIENNDELEERENENDIIVSEEPQNNTQEQDTQEQKIITATKKVFGEENYINVFYEPEDNFVLIKAKGKDLLSSSMSAKGMLKSIKDTLYEIREIPDLNVDFNIVYTMVNSSGDTSDDIVIKATYKNETRNSINWDEYVLHEDMPKIADEWWAHPAIQAELEE